MSTSHLRLNKKRSHLKCETFFYLYIIESEQGKAQNFSLPTRISFINKTQIIFLL